MLTLMRPGATGEQVDAVCARIKEVGFVPHQIPGAMRTAMAGANHQQPNDPQKLGPALLKLVNTAKPPVRLPLGPDTVEAIEKKNAFVAQELAEWREVAVSTAF